MLDLLVRVREHEFKSAQQLGHDTTYFHDGYVLPDAGSGAEAELFVTATSGLGISIILEGV